MIKGEQCSSALGDLYLVEAIGCYSLVPAFLSYSKLEQVVQFGNGFQSKSREARVDIFNCNFGRDLDGLFMILHTSYHGSHGKGILTLLSLLFIVIFGMKF